MSRRARVLAPLAAALLSSCVSIAYTIQADEVTEDILSYLHDAGLDR